MHKHSKNFLDRRSAMFLGLLASIAATLLVIWGGPASATPTSPAGKVDIYQASSHNAANVGTVILTGAITDHGIDHEAAAGGGKFNKLTLSKGSFEVNAAALGKKLTSFPVNPKTCATAGTATGQVSIVNGTGTGAYRGIRGTFQTTATQAGILPRLNNHHCNMSAARGYPDILMAKASGSVSYK